MIIWLRVELFLLRGNDAVSVQIVILLDSRHYFYLPNSRSHLINTHPSYDKTRHLNEQYVITIPTSY